MGKVRLYIRVMVFYQKGNKKRKKEAKRPKGGGRRE